MNEATDTSTSEVTQLAQTTTDEWFTIDKIVKHKRVRGKDMYLVQWADNGGQSWTPRKDISDFAIQEYYKTRSRKKCKRRCS